MLQAQEKARNLYLRVADLLEQVAGEGEAEELEGKQQRKGGDSFMQQQQPTATTPPLPAAITIDLITEVSSVRLCSICACHGQHQS